jgi:hypothetical protein
MGNIRQSLRQLASETGSSNDPTSTNFSRDVRVIDQSVARILAKPVSQRTKGETTALRALEYWSSSPDSFATTTTRPATNGMAELSATDKNGADLKCNRFVAEVATEAGFGFPLKLGWNGNNPRTAEKIYTDGIPNTTTVDAKNAKIGDIISFSGHVGIYLGNGLYASARSSTDRLGNQVTDGVQITRVPWNSTPPPKIYRMKENQLSSNSTNGSDTTQPTVVATGATQPPTGESISAALAAESARIQLAVDPDNNMDYKGIYAAAIKYGSGTEAARLVATDRAIDQGMTAEQAASNVAQLKQQQLVVTG